jgi:hypothetical protein
MAAASKIVQAAIEVLAKKSGGALPAATVPLKTLPTDEASRMARAREMGFDVDAYKGAPATDWRTGEDITEFQVPHSKTVEDVYPDYVGKKGGHAGFFTDDIPTANRFAGAGTGEGAAVFPTKLKFENPLVIDAGGKPARDFQFGRNAEASGTGNEYDEVKRVFEGNPLPLRPVRPRQERQRRHPRGCRGHRSRWWGVVCDAWQGRGPRPWTCEPGRP